MHLNWSNIYKYTVIVIYIVQWKLYINHKIEIYTDIYMGAYIYINNMGVFDYHFKCAYIYDSIWRLNKYVLNTYNIVRSLFYKI